MIKQRLVLTRWDGLQVLGIGFIALLIALGITQLLLVGETRLAVAATVFVLIIGVSIYDLRVGVIICLLYAIVMGDLRRLLLLVESWSGSDPLLLIAPGFVILIFFYLLASRRITIDTPISISVVILMTIMAAQIFNPRQGGLVVGMAGVLFLMVPLFWFWIGRVFATLSFFRLLIFRILPFVGTIALLFGLYQVLVGYLPYQLTWFHTAGYAGIGNLDTGLAPISFFASGSEHGVFVIITGVLILVLGLTKDRRFLALLPIVVIGTLLTGSRGPVAKLFLVGAGLWALQGQSVRSWIPRGVLIFSLTALVLIFSLSYISSRGVSHSVVEHKLGRQAQEFVHAEGGAGGRSTALGHLMMLFHGYRIALSEPLGRGLGATSLAAKLDSRSSFGKSTETDLGDSFVALGIIGGLTYHIIVFLVIYYSFLLWVRTRDPRVLAILGVLGVTFLQWLGGGQYAVSAIVWVCIGALDRIYRSSLQIGHS
jgi:hypothetical protein